MAWIGDELKTFLKTKSGITAIVGAATAAKIFEISKEAGIPQRIGKRTRFITYQLFGGSSTGWLGGELGFASNRVELRAYGNTHADCASLMDLVRFALQPNTGLKATWNTTTISSVSVETTPESGVLPSQRGGDFLRFYLAQDFTINYEISIAT